MPAIARSSQHLALGRAVRAQRVRQRLSQEELGFRAGLHRNYVGAVERGELNPTYGVLLRLCGGLRVPLAELVAPRRGAHARTLPLWNGRTPRSSC
jgi:transcriptional regulator with XRE-family HTH domain